jgi:hypothetical protein
VTDGAGFVGSHLAESLLAADTEAVVAGDFSTGRPRWVRDGAHVHKAEFSETTEQEVDPELAYSIFYRPISSSRCCRCAMSIRRLFSTPPVTMASYSNPRMLARK